VKSKDKNKIKKKRNIYCTCAWNFANVVILTLKPQCL